MGVSDQRHAPAALYPRTGGWVGLRADQDTCCSPGSKQHAVQVQRGGGEKLHMFIKPRHWMDVSSQRHALALVLPGEESLVPIWYKIGDLDPSGALLT
jgi:hypothetical protein